MSRIESLIRPGLRNLIPYSSARDDFSGEANIWLDANENPYEQGYNRYPDPYQRKLKKRISELKQVPAENIFLGNGSDEVIDLLIRAFCEPGKDSVTILPPTYGMYKVAAGVNNVSINLVGLEENFQPNVDKILNESRGSKLLFLCSPNNPTGNLIERDRVEALLSFDGLVVIDEAYIDFSPERSWSQEILNHDNLFVMQTLSKAWGLAGLRLGMGFASAEIVRILNRIKPPYNISLPAQEEALLKLKEPGNMQQQVTEILEQRDWLTEELSRLPMVMEILDSQANFLLVRFSNSEFYYKALLERGIVIRDRSRELHCKHCLRITVGTPEENQELIKTLNTLNA